MNKRKKAVQPFLYVSASRQDKRGGSKRPKEAKKRFPPPGVGVGRRRHGGRPGARVKNVETAEPLGFWGRRSDRPAIPRETAVSGASEFGGKKKAGNTDNEWTDVEMQEQ